VPRGGVTILNFYVLDKMRNVKIWVGGVSVGEQKTWAYPNGQALGYYMIPIYNCSVEGTDNAGKPVRELFNVLRFGVQSKDGKTATVVGLASPQMHVIKAYLPNYSVHSALSLENGAWQVHESFLIHDGPDNPTEVFATIGCIEIMGHREFIKFNDLIISLSGPKAMNRQRQLIEIGRSGCLSIKYDGAERPRLKKIN
jgi:hypothetical protein